MQHICKKLNPIKQFFNYRTSFMLVLRALYKVMTRSIFYFSSKEIISSDFNKFLRVERHLKN